MTAIYDPQTAMSAESLHGAARNFGRHFQKLGKWHVVF
jgi:hypothetical protein